MNSSCIDHEGEFVLGGCWGGEKGGERNGGGGGKAEEWVIGWVGSGDGSGWTEEDGKSVGFILVGLRGACLRDVSIIGRGVLLWGQGP